MNLPVSVPTSLRIKSKKKLTHFAYLKDDEVQAIFEYLNTRISEYPGIRKLYMKRYKFLFEVMLYTGARIGETVPWYNSKLKLQFGLRPKDFKLDEGQNGIVHIQSEKKRSVHPQREVPMTVELKSAFMQYLLDTKMPIDSKDFLFPITRQAADKFLKKIGKEKGITGIETKKKDRIHELHSHMFRHTFGVRCAVSGIPITVAQDWMGHGDPFVTTMYQQVTGIDTSSFMQMVRPINEATKYERY